MWTVEAQVDLRSSFEVMRFVSRYIPDGSALDYGQLSLNDEVAGNNLRHEPLGVDELSQRGR